MINASPQVLSAKHHDGFIFGASSLEHCVANNHALGQGPLPKALVEAYDKAWQITKPIAPGYFSGYGTVAGSSDNFLRQFQEHVPSS
jgi:hypothetical protein